MRFSRPKKRIRLRLVGGCLLALAGIAIGAGLAHPNGPSWPDPLGVYAAGFSGLGFASFIALPFAAIFALLVIVGEHRQVNRRILSQRFRNRQNAIESGRVLAVIFGAGALIVGCLIGLYAVLSSHGSETRSFETFTLAGACIGGGLIAYGAGRFQR